MAPPGGISFASILSISGLIVFGTVTSLFAKIVYELQGPGRDGVDKYFRKPYFMTTVMFLGMSFCLPLAFLEQWQQRRRQAAAGAEEAEARYPLLNNAVAEESFGDSGKERSEWKQTLMLAIPTAFDLVATVLMNVGLLSVTASVYQMMRGAEMLFAALFAVVFLRRTLNRFHILGILCCVAGITLVGLSSVLSGEGSQTHVVSVPQMLLGMGLIVGSQAVQAAQITFEDYFMADLAIAPLKIVGWEGVIGLLAMLAIMLPLVYVLPGVDGEGVHEDTLDSLHMVGGSTALPLLLVVDMAALLLYNFSGMCVTGQLGAVFRTVLETTRTLFVWLVDLVLFYTPLGMGTLGESWSTYSLIQAAGFVVLVCGTLVYGRGDEAEARKAAAAAEADGLAGAAEEAGTPRRFAPVAVPGGGRGASLGGRPGSLPSAPVAMRHTPSSFKSTMNLAPFSYSSIPRSAAFPADPA